MTTVIKNMKCNFTYTRAICVQTTPPPPPPPPVVIKHRTCDLLPLLLTILNELNSGFKNFEKPHPPISRPGEYNDIHFF